MRLLLQEQTPRWVKLRRMCERQVCSHYFSLSEKDYGVVQALISTSLAIVVAVVLVEGITYDGFNIDVKQTISRCTGDSHIRHSGGASSCVLQVNLALGGRFFGQGTPCHCDIHSGIPRHCILVDLVFRSDKTETLTTAKMSIISKRIYAQEGFSADEVTMYAYLCSNQIKRTTPSIALSSTRSTRTTERRKVGD